MWPDRVSNPVALALETDVLPTALRGPVDQHEPLNDWGCADMFIYKFIMHQLNNQPYSRDITYVISCLCRTALERVISGIASRSDL